jgi:hypothetical protein
MTTLIADEWPVARKEHQCIWCGEPIVIGEKYRRCRLIWEGDPITNKWHKECDDAAANVDLEEGFDPYAFKRGTDEEMQ